LPRDESKATGESLVAFYLGTPVSIYNRELYLIQMKGQDIIAKVCNTRLPPWSSEGTEIQMRHIFSPPYRGGVGGGF
jgi:hypothetical protein